MWEAECAIHEVQVSSPQGAGGRGREKGEHANRLEASGQVLEVWRDCSPATGRSTRIPVRASLGEGRIMILMPESTGAGWVLSHDDPRAAMLHAEPRGTPADAFYEHGGWRCAGAMGFYGFDIDDHLITIPFYVSGTGDLRHCCYCGACAWRFLRLRPPGSDRGR